MVATNPNLLLIMSRPKATDYHDFRRKISSQYQMSCLRQLEKKWCMSISDICWQFITEGIKREKSKMDEMDEIRNTKK